MVTSPKFQPSTRQQSAQTTAISLDPWAGRYAARANGLTASEVRALFAVASRPEVVSLAGGMPYVAALPKEQIEGALAEVAGHLATKALQYGSGQGEIELRELIPQLLALEGIDADPDDIVITTGSQQALDLIGRLFLDPGDTVITEGPSYVGALGVFRSYEAEVCHVPLDDEGLNPAAFESTLTQLAAAGRTPKFLYTIPNFQNPAGVLLSAARRPEILEIANRFGVLVVEDNPYGQLYFNAPPPAALRSLDAQNVVYLGSFSKILSPGLRVGYAVAPRGIKEKLVLENESAILSHAVFSQLVVAEYLKRADWLGQIETYRALYRERRDAMLAALSQELPNLHWTNPDGGFFIWLTLPEALDAKAMLPLAIRELVAYTPGSAFYADGHGQHHIRLSFCYPTPDEIRIGIQRLARVIDSETELLRTFHPAPQQGSTASSIASPPPNLH